MRAPAAWRRRLRAAVLAGTLGALLAGCISPAGIDARSRPIAAHAVGLPDGDAGAPVDAQWWRAFADPQLTSLIERALAENPSLAVAGDRLARAEAVVDGSRAAAGPQLGGQADATRQRFSGNSIYPPPLGGSTRTLGTLQANGSWELDFFGRNRAAIESAAGAQRAARADAAAARVLLASNVATSYVQLGRLFEQRRIAERALAQREQTLALIRQRVRGGLDTNVELRQGEGALPETRQQIEGLDEQIALTRHALAALTVQPPDALDKLAPTLSALRPPMLPTTLPADLLGRRADVTAARWRIEAASQDMASARAQFYPNVNLVGFVGLASIGLDQLVKSGSENGAIGPAVRLPLFDAGRLRANLRGKAADVDAAVDSYNGAVITAVHDVADQLASLRSLERQQAEQAAAQSAAESAYDLATQRFRAGLASYLTVLNAETGVLAQRRLGADLAARGLDTRFALIRALGGGYAGDPVALATPRP